MRALTRAALLTIRSTRVKIFALSTIQSLTTRFYRQAFACVNKPPFLLHWPSIVTGLFFAFSCIALHVIMQDLCLALFFLRLLLTLLLYVICNFFFGHLCRLCLVNFGRLIVLLFYVAASSSPPETLQLPGTFPLLKSGECHENVMDKCTLTTKFR